MPYRVAIIGAGNMAHTHSRAWSKIGEAEVIGLLDRHPDHAELLAGKLGVPIFTEWETLMGQAPDIIDICAPTPTHKDFAVRAALAEKNVFLEKPMARNLAECDEIIHAVEQAGVTLMVGHVVRFFPEFARAKHMVDGGSVGRPAAVRCARVSSHPRGSVANWYADPAESGGVFLDLAIHDFDWLRWCFGDIERVFAKGLHGKSEFHGSLDYGLATLKFKSGVLAHVCGSWAHLPGLRATFEICGDNGMLEHDSIRSAPLTIALKQRDGGVPGVALPDNSLMPRDDPYYLELRHFLDCLQAGTKPMVTMQDARAAVQVALAAIESVETGKPVTLP
jgi:predicted dehydrogenase